MLNSVHHAMVIAAVIFSGVGLVSEIADYSMNYKTASFQRSRHWRRLPVLFIKVHLSWLRSAINYISNCTKEGNPNYTECSIHWNFKIDYGKRCLHFLNNTIFVHQFTMRQVRWQIQNDSSSKIDPWSHFFFLISHNFGQIWRWL